MLGAIVRVHWPKGLWVTNGEYEYPLTNIALAVAVLAGRSFPPRRAEVRRAA